MNMNDLFLAAAMCLTMVSPAVTTLGIVVMNHSYRRLFYVVVAVAITMTIILMVWMFSWQVRPTWNINSQPGMTLPLIVLFNLAVSGTIMSRSWWFDKNYQEHVQNENDHKVTPFVRRSV